MKRIYKLFYGKYKKEIALVLKFFRIYHIREKKLNEQARVVGWDQAIKKWFSDVEL